MNEQMKSWEDIKPLHTYHFRNSLGKDLYRTVIDVSKHKVTYTKSEVKVIFGNPCVASPEVFIRAWRMYGVTVEVVADGQ